MEHLTLPPQKEWQEVPDSDTRREEGRNKGQEEIGPLSNMPKGRETSSQLPVWYQEVSVNKVLLLWRCKLKSAKALLQTSHINLAQTFAARSACAANLQHLTEQEVIHRSVSNECASRLEPLHISG